jgi:hypothetical protein
VETQRYTGVVQCRERVIGITWDGECVRKEVKNTHTFHLLYWMNCIVVKALEYRVSQHDQDINALDWEVRGEDGAYEEPEQLELSV